MDSEHVEVLRELRGTGDVSDWRAMESALDAAIAVLSAQQPAAVDGVWLRPVIKQGDYVAKWGFCNPEEPDAVCFFPSPQQGGES